MRIKNFTKPVFLFPLLLILVELILFAANYKPGTYLIGWDNIMPEFNFSANFERSINSVWQEYRGLGVLDGLAHSANFFHTIYLFLLSIFLPESLLRYIYIHLTHIVGGISFFFLARKLTKNNGVSFIGALFYMLNIGVVQMYFAPLEVFATHFAALPLLALLATNALEKTNAKNILILFLASLFLSQQGFVPTVFIAFGILLGFILLINIIKTRRLKPAIVVFSVVLFANIYWALPYSYSALNTAQDIAGSRINQFSSEEIFFRNKTFGNLGSVLSLKGFMIDSIELDPDNFRNTYFMDGWRSLTEGIFYQAVYLVFLALMILGAVMVIYKKRLDFLPYLLTFIVGFIFLANDAPLLGQINDFTRNTFPLIGEAFRFPFTKFMTLFAFCFSLLLTLGLYYFLRFRWFEKIGSGMLALIFIWLLFISYPAFLGNFTSPYLKLNIPNDYFELFDYMKEKNIEERVALFPVQTFWNWQYRSWGHRGSGFIWYGMAQPIFERAFDPWSPYNEQFYNEISYAVGSQDEVLFDQLIRKYDLSYIVLDQYILNSLSQKEINYESLKSFLERSPSVEIENTFGKVILYKTNLKNDWVYSLDRNSTKKVFSNYSFENLDSIYPLTDNYVKGEADPSVINIFPSLFSQKLQEDLEFSVTNSENQYTLIPKEIKPYDLSEYVLRIPNLFETEFLVPVGVSFENGVLALLPIYPDIFVNEVRVDVKADPIIIRSETLLDADTITFVDTSQELNVDDPNAKAYILNHALNSIKLTDGFGNTELLVFDSNLVDRRSYFATLPEGKIEDLSITIPKTEAGLSSTGIIEGRQYEIKKRSSGPFAKPFSRLSSTEGLGYVDLLARDGSVEVTFYLPELYHAGSYIVLTDVEYKSGLPMRFYVDNDTERKAEVEAVFSKDKNEAVMIIPKTNNFFKGYGFHFIVKSVGKELSESSLEGVEVHPFPAKFVRSLQFIDRTTYERPFNLNPKLPVENERVRNSLYTAEAKPDSILVLSQSYDDGWRAYQVSGQKSAVSSWLAQTFPFFFGKELKNHVLVNNWANGWEIGPGASSKEPAAIIIVYLPSFIQYHAWIITLGSLMVISVIYLKHKHIHH